MTEPGLFIVGTDTGVGKTVIAAALIHYLREKGINVSAFKPVETGGRDDSILLHKAAGGQGPLELVNPYTFKHPISPHQASEEEARFIDIAVILDAFNKLKERHEFIIAEGAGGLLVPLGSNYLLADLIGELDLPVLVVARAAVGTINHTLLTVKHAQSLGLEVAGVVINHEKPMPESERISRPHDLANYITAPLLGTLPHLKKLDSRTLTETIVEKLDLSPLRLP